MGEIITPRTRNIWVRLAGEGVPIAAIARAFKAEFHEVFEVLKEALARQDIAQIPLPDWKPGVDRETEEARARPAAMSLAAGDERMRGVHRLMLRFSISAACAEIVYSLATSSTVVTRDEMLRRTSSRYGTEDEPDPQVIATLISRMRQTLLRSGIRIDAINQAGYFMPPACRLIALKIAAGETNGEVV